MKIVHCFFSFTTGGAETMLVDIINEQVKIASVTIIILNASYEPSLLAKIDPRARIVCLDRKPSSRSPWPILKFNWMLRRMRPDAIHVHNSTLPAIVFPLAGRRLFFTVHAMNVPIKYAARVTCIFAVSDAVKQDILSRGSFPVLTVPNGIVPERVAKREPKAVPGDGVLKIVQVARLDAETKGQDILIRAIALLREKGCNNVSVDFIGEGASEGELKKLAAELQVADRIRFLGLRDRDYIYAHLKDYDIMCHPARYEGFGLTIAEAMAAKLPVLVATGDGPYEVIGRGEFGSTFENGSVEDCADRIKQLHEDYRTALDRVDRAWEHVTKHYSVERMAREYIDAYRTYQK